MTAQIEKLNTLWHEKALWVFTTVVVVHWAEHIIQGIQVFLLGWSRPESRGLLGQEWPWLATSEALHYGYAVVMLAFLFILRPGFLGRARVFWDVALAVQFFHHFEHLTLLIQKVSGDYWFGAAVPTSLVQNFLSRVELHLLYNGLVTIPMVIAVLIHMFPPEQDRGLAMSCSCNKTRGRDADHAAVAT